MLVNTNLSTYVTIGGLRSTTITLNDESVDITNKDSLGHRQLLAGAGTIVYQYRPVVCLLIPQRKKMREKVFAQQNTSDGSTDQTATFNNRIQDPTFRGIDRSFQITSLEYAGEHNGEVTYSMSFESAGYITYAAL